MPPQRLLAAFTAALSLAGIGQAQSLTTTFADDSEHDGNMFDVVAKRKLRLDAIDVHFDDANHPVPCGAVCSVTEVEVYYADGGHAPVLHDPSFWTLVGSVQHVTSTPRGVPQPLALPLGILMDDTSVTGPRKIGMYVTSTQHLLNSVTGLPNEYIRFTSSKNTYENVDLKFVSGTGNVYPFGGTFDPSTWNGTIHYTNAPGCASATDTYCTAGFSASGCQAQVSAVGTPSVTQPSGFVVTATGVEGDKDGIFFYGQAGRQATPWGNGTSLRCVASPVKRGGLIQGVGTPGQCDNSYSQDLNARWCPTCTHPGHTPTAGLKMQLQCWYRDPFNTSNQSTSMSDALEVDMCP